MAIPGRKFELDLDADNFTFKSPIDEQHDGGISVRDVTEHDSLDVPTAPTLKQTKTGFPEHKERRTVSAFKRKNPNLGSDGGVIPPRAPDRPSDAAIRAQLDKSHGADFETQQRIDVRKENEQRLVQMSSEEIEEARRELLGGLSPAMIERLLKRANLEDGHSNVAPAISSERQSAHHGGSNDVMEHFSELDSGNRDPAELLNNESSIHFPTPYRQADDYKALDPDSNSFGEDLRAMYFPELPHDPSALAWLQDVSAEDEKHSSYNPDLTSYAASSLRFNFNGRLISPKDSLSIPVTKGLHHHGEAPGSAGYTVPELTLLARSTMPNQRCVAYQVIGRLLYRLGKGEMGHKDSEIEDAMWDIISRERILELVLAEANKQGGHASARAYATEALWLWRKGGGDTRALPKQMDKQTD